MAFKNLETLFNNRLGTNFISFRNTSFSPASISGLVWWQDPSYGITKDGSNKVSAWLSREGSSFTFTQGTAANQPVYNATGINNQPTVDFTKASNHFMTSSNLASAIGPRTFICVWQGGNTAGTPQNIFSSQTGPFYISQISATSGYNGIYDGTWRQSTPNSTSAQVITITHKSAETKWYTNGTIQLSLGGNQRAIGGTSGIGADYTGTSQFYEGKIAEIVMYNSILTQANIDLLESYFGAKYNITVA